MLEKRSGSASWERLTEEVGVGKDAGKGEKRKMGWDTRR